jgi:hypothetical protein
MLLREPRERERECSRIKERRQQPKVKKHKLSSL